MSTPTHLPSATLCQSRHKPCARVNFILQSGTLDLALGYTVVKMGLRHNRFSSYHPIQSKKAMAGTKRMNQTPKILVRLGAMQYFSRLLNDQQFYFMLLKFPKPVPCGSEQYVLLRFRFRLWKSFRFRLRIQTIFSKIFQQQ
jgi:hypothetical protein